MVLRRVGDVRLRGSPGVGNLGHAPHTSAPADAPAATRSSELLADRQTRMRGGIEGASRTPFASVLESTPSGSYQLFLTEAALSQPEPKASLFTSSS